MFVRLTESRYFISESESSVVTQLVDSDVSMRVLESCGPSLVA